MLVRKSPAFSLSSPPAIKTGHSYYLRDILRAPRYSAAPTGGLATDPQPKGNLDVRDSMKTQARLHPDCGSVTRPPIDATE